MGSDENSACPRSVAVLGSTGFVGSAVAAALDGRVVQVASPRVHTAARSVDEMRSDMERAAPLIESLAEQLAGCESLVVASGLPDATGDASDAMFGANSMVPLVALKAAELAGVKRLVHVSSAVVQGGAKVLDASENKRPFSAYGRSKALAEDCLLSSCGESAVGVVIYRPPSVHAESRRITGAITRVAASPFNYVPDGRDQPSPQALLENVAAAVAFLATTENQPPRVVHHPWEGVTVQSLFEDLGGKAPKQAPRVLLRLLDLSLRATGFLIPRLRPHARRLEMLWFGQVQGASWLSQIGWVPAVGQQRWKEIGAAIRK
jgi:nucleoside-diphosphate-sugar epimerase